VFFCTKHNPTLAGAAKYVNGQIRFAYGLNEFNFKSGSFSKDSRGRWYFNLVVEVQQVASTGTGEIGIDLGLKATATCS